MACALPLCVYSVDLAFVCVVDP